MCQDWYIKYLPDFEDSLAPFHEIIAIKIQRSIGPTEKVLLSDRQIHDWLRGNGDDYLVRAMYVDQN
jgi:hypothetical protein